MSEEVLIPSKTDALAEKLIQVLNGGALGIMMSVGHRTGLFDSMSQLAPAASEEIAVKAGLSERHVREWLAAMVTGRIVEYNPENRTYWLPPEHAAILTRAASPNNFAGFMQFFSVMGAVEDQVVEAFTHGKGVPYSAYTRFHEVMAEESMQTVVAALSDHILPLVPGLQERLEEGLEVLDVGCGSGRAMNFLAAVYPKSHFSGYDISEEGIGAARSEAKQKGLTNVRFEVRDAAAFGEDSSFDLITAFDAIHDQPQPEKALRNVFRALRPGGVFLMQDIAASSNLEENLEHPVGTLLYTASCMHCMEVSLAAGGPGLGAMWGRQVALGMLHEAGFDEVRVEQLPHDFQNYYYVMTKG